MDILDNANIVAQRDPFGALGVAANQWQQLTGEVRVRQFSSSDVPIKQIVLAGMGGSALAAGIAKDWLDLPLPFEIVRGYRLPKYVGPQTLVIASSYSGNTEETFAALDQAVAAGAAVAVLASGGQLIEVATEKKLPYVELLSGVQPRMAVFANLAALVAMLEAYGILHSVTPELHAAAQRLEHAADGWQQSVPAPHNAAKQLALHLAGKTPVIYASALMRSIAYKWKISFNENAKNVAFWNELPEFNHNEFLGWTSHPVQKPYGVIELRSSYDDPRIAKRFTVTNRLLSGKRPHPETVELQGETMIEQMLWGALLADMTSVYLALLNGVEPTKVELIEKFKTELQRKD